MVEPSFWADRAADFERIAHDPPMARDQGGITASYYSLGPQWIIGGGPSEGARDEFKTVAALCAVHGIGCPNLPTAWTFWLDRLLKEDLDIEWVDIDSGPSDLGVVESSSATLHDASRSSARLCRKLYAEAVKQLQAELSDEENTPPKSRDSTPSAPAPAAAVLVWKDVEIRFLSDHNFQATVRGKLQAPQNYADAGFGDGRQANEKPKAAWEALRRLAEKGGVITKTKTAAEWPKLERRMQELRKWLKARFQIDADPVPYLDGGYRAQFTIGVSAPYEPER